MQSLKGMKPKRAAEGVGRLLPGQVLSKPEAPCPRLWGVSPAGRGGAGVSSGPSPSLMPHRCTRGSLPTLGLPPPEGPQSGPSRDPGARGNGPRDPEAPFPVVPHRELHLPEAEFSFPSCFPKPGLLQRAVAESKYPTLGPLMSIFKSNFFQRTPKTEGGGLPSPVPRPNDQGEPRLDLGQSTALPRATLPTDGPATGPGPPGSDVESRRHRHALQVLAESPSQESRGAKVGLAPSVLVEGVEGGQARRLRRRGRAGPGHPAHQSPVGCFPRSEPRLFRRSISGSIVEVESKGLPPPPPLLPRSLACGSSRGLTRSQIPPGQPSITIWTLFSIISSILNRSKVIGRLRLTVRPAGHRPRGPA
ncbi:translation initiation factor IF-2-like isoform X1 [Monodelphis domestica]|uniref:translation initiation factor IF-2-like isoform X1 n=1 Tax=Monodelphis domestica TaxID=13616 RepID=UPI0024E2430A|nr:translation initiation factor IF-2-like isoform X1 [Monodelphis domestica]